MAMEKRIPKSSETITLNDPTTKVTVRYSASSDGIVHIKEDSRVIPLSDLRPDENNPTNWIYIGDMKQLTITILGLKIKYEAVNPISGEDEKLLRKWVSTGQKDANARKGLERRGIRIIDSAIEHNNYPVRPFTGDEIRGFLAQYGYTGNPQGLVQPSFDEYVSEGEGIAYLDVNADAVRKGNVVPDRPIRITFHKTANRWEVKSVKELEPGVKSKALDRLPETKKIWPWPDKPKKSR
jgi:hypothetical protein